MWFQRCLENAPLTHTLSHSPVDSNENGVARRREFETFTYLGYAVVGLLALTQMTVSIC